MTYVLLKLLPVFPFMNSLSHFGVCIRKTSNSISRRTLYNRKRNRIRTPAYVQDEARINL